MPPANSTLLWPMFAMFVLSVIVLIRMVFTRFRAVKKGEVKAGYFKTYTVVGGPDDMLKASRHFSNLFEAPVLFYVACILGMIFSEGNVFSILAWIYVSARVVHAYVHMGSNKLNPRMGAYFVGWLALGGMWIVLAIHQIPTV